MSSHSAAEREALLARLAESRAEIGRLLEPPPQADAQGADEATSADGTFPRSRIMRALLTGRGMGAMGAVAGGLLLSRPKLAWRLLRMLPTGAVTRMMAARLMDAMRGGKR